MSPEDFAAAANVSRETLDRLKVFAATLEKYNRATNLVSRASLDDLWRRHVLDSAQLFALLPTRGRGAAGAVIALDLGSGAGFPGLVLAIMAAGAGRPLRAHLVEADRRKAAFLREAARQTAAAVTVHATRIEALEPFAVDVITARAVAPLPKLLDLCEGFTGFPGAAPMILALKGQRIGEELTAAYKGWKMTVEVIPSQAEAGVFVLRLMDVRRG